MLHIIVAANIVDVVADSFKPNDEKALAGQRIGTDHPPILMPFLCVLSCPSLRTPQGGIEKNPLRQRINRQAGLT